MALAERPGSLPPLAKDIGLGKRREFVPALRSSTSTGCNQGQFGEVGTIAACIARQQAISGDRRVSTDEEVWQRRSPRPAMPPVNEKSLPGEKCGLVWDCLPPHEGRQQRLVEIFDPRIPNGDFGKDDRVNHQTEGFGRSGERLG